MTSKYCQVSQLGIDSHNDILRRCGYMKKKRKKDEGTTIPLDFSNPSHRNLFSAAMKSGDVMIGGKRAKPLKKKKGR